MSARRIEGFARGAPITITVNGQPVRAYAGESIAAALLAAGIRVFRRPLRSTTGIFDPLRSTMGILSTDAGDSPRGLFCGMGICFDCRVTVDDVPNLRACMTEAREGCVVDIA